MHLDSIVPEETPEGGDDTSAADDGAIVDR